MIHSYTIRARAKLNFSLDILSRRPDGYHEIRSLMQSLELSDRLTLTATGRCGEVDVDCSDASVPLDARNLAWQAATRWLAESGVRTGLSIRIEKEIPLASGLAGGSSNAAAVVHGLEAMFAIKLPHARQHQLLMGLGADVPFCYQGGTALCEGIGERISPQVACPPYPVLLLKPAFGTETADAFARMDREGVGERRPDEIGLAEALAAKDWPAVEEKAWNVFQPGAVREQPLIGRLLQLLRQTGAMLARLSGSGPTVFGVYEDEEAARFASAQIEVQLPAGSRLFATRVAFDRAEAH